MTRIAAVAVLAACWAGSSAAGEVSVAPSLLGLQLRERGSDGRELVRESGLLVGAQASWHSEPGALGGTWVAGLGLAAGRPDYDGETQGGRAITSHTATNLLRARLGWALPIAGGWSAQAIFDGEWYRRRIEPTRTAAGLDERLSQARLGAGLAWESDAVTVGAVMLAGGRAPLRVRFDGDRFDAVTLRSGRAKGIALTVGYRLAPGWRLGAGVERLDVGASLPRTLTSGGRPVGEVRQPSWRRDLVWLTAVWSPGG